MFRSMARLVFFISLAASISGCGEPAEPNAPPRVAESPAPAEASPSVKIIKQVQTIPPTAVAKQRPAGKSETSGELELVEAVQRGDLAKVVRTELSPDGKFLYATCWNPGSLVVFARDPATGSLTHVQTINGNPDLAGATGMALSPDGQFAVAVAFSSKVVTLFRRDMKSGELTRVESAPRNPQDVEFPVAATFSPNGKFVCIADNGTNSSPGGVRVYRLDGDKFVDVGIDQGRSRCFQGARSLAFHPDGKTLFIACCAPGSLVVADFDSEKGTTKVRQVLWAAPKGGGDFSQSDVGQVTGIEGLIDVVPGPDGRFVTTSSGRFNGPTVIASFKFGDNGHLVFVTALKSSGRSFAGGNQLAVSPDGRSVYVAGTLSGVIACAGRDPKTGQLGKGPLVPDGAPPGASADAKSPAGVTITADGKFLYVATEEKNAISIFRRSPKN